MGYDTNRFLRETIPPELLCNNCRQVPIDPVQCRDCQVLCCEACLPSACGHGFGALVDLNTYIHHKLNQLILRCQFPGCDNVCKLEEIEMHEKECPYRFGSSNLKTCESCRGPVPQDDPSSHNCIEYLKALNDAYDLAYLAMEQNLEEVKKDVINTREKSILIKSATESKIQELEAEIAKVSAEISLVQDQYAKELEILQSDNTKAYDSTKNNSNKKMSKFLDRCEGMLDEYSASLQEDLKFLVSKSKEALEQYHNKMREDFLNLNKSK